MTKLLSAAVFSLLVFSACSHDTDTSSSPTHRKPDREYNTMNGNFERQPPFGPRSNKSTE